MNTRMSDSEAIMWAVEKDPALRSDFCNLTVLDSAPDPDRLRARSATRSRRSRGSGSGWSRLRCASCRRSGSTIPTSTSTTTCAGSRRRNRAGMRELLDVCAAAGRSAVRPVAAAVGVHGDRRPRRRPHRDAPEDAPHDHRRCRRPEALARARRLRARSGTGRADGDLDDSDVDIGATTPDAIDADAEALPGIRPSTCCAARSATWSGRHLSATRERRGLGRPRPSPTRREAPCERGGSAAHGGIAAPPAARDRAGAFDRAHGPLAAPAPRGVHGRDARGARRGRPDGSVARSTTCSSPASRARSVATRRRWAAAADELRMAMPVSTRERGEAGRRTASCRPRPAGAHRTRTTSASASRRSPTACARTRSEPAVGAAELLAGVRVRAPHLDARRRDAFADPHDRLRDIEPPRQPGPACTSRARASSRTIRSARARAARSTSPCSRTATSCTWASTSTPRPSPTSRCS